jgi:hypothetical protein
MNFFARGFLLISSVLGIQIANAQGTASLAVEDPRPVAKAVQILVSRYGYVITYEDPRYAYGDDVQDVTDQVRKDLDKYPPGKAPRVLIPRGEKLALNVPSTATSQDVRATLNSLVQMSRQTGGHFRMLEAGSVFHVIPMQVRNVDGNWGATTSILDEAISMATQDRTEYELIKDICNAVSSAANVSVKIGLGIGQGGLRIGPEPRYSFGAHNEVARDVLMRALAATSEAKRTWLLLYDVSQKAYFLNLLRVPDLAPKPAILPSAVSQPTITAPSGSSAVVSPCNVATTTACK